MKDTEKLDIYFRHNEFRDSQKKMITDILMAIEERKNILIHAPTGTGKTDASISAAITYAKKNNLKVLFLTPKISQHKIALEVVDGINKKYQTNIKAIDFVGKKNMCIDPAISTLSSNFYEVCKKSREKHQCPFFENIRPKDKSKKEILNYKINKAFQDKNTLSHLDIKNISEEFTSISEKPMPICAYELAKLYAKKCDVIIADYYHVFSRKISDSLLGELNLDLKNCIIIIDEAHNLEDRILKLLSKSLNTYQINRAIKECKEIKNSKLRKVLENLIKNLKNLENKKLTKENESFINKDDLLEIYKDNIFEIIEELEKQGLNYIEKTENPKSSLLTVSLFLDAWVNDKEYYIRFIKKENNSITIKYNALEVSKITKYVFENCYSSIIMSATLTPLEMYKNIFGLEDHNTISKEYFSSFDKKKRLNLLITDVSTKYNKRTDIEFLKIADYITKSINAVPGNCIIFFPSFKLMHEILRHVKINKPKLIQEEKMSSNDFENLIFEFKKYARSFGSAMFAVMGGKASEGIDLPGKYLISTIIVGIPLSRMNIEVKSKIEYYEKKYKKGWLYAYIQPAIQKTIQSAGRLIRTHSDKGVAIFMDERYNWENYRKCLPHDIRFKKTNNPSKEIVSFFENN